MVKCQYIRIFREKNQCCRMTTFLFPKNKSKIQTRHNIYFGFEHLSSKAVLLTFIDLENGD